MQANFLRAPPFDINLPRRSIGTQCGTATAALATFIAAVAVFKLMVTTAAVATLMAATVTVAKPAVSVAKPAMAVAKPAAAEAVSVTTIVAGPAVVEEWLLNPIMLLDSLHILALEASLHFVFIPAEQDKKTLGT